MSDPFVHLHVASGYSMRHGASPPPVLVERATEHGMDTLALTDRDGVYGAVKFVTACMSHGIRPILGADLAVAPCDAVVVVVCHRRPRAAAEAARLLTFARDLDVPVTLTNAVRGADRTDGPTLDVLDAARRLVALDARHLDRVNAEAYLKSGKEM